jgi:CRP-like cAMP-binding protein
MLLDVNARAELRTSQCCPTHPAIDRVSVLLGSYLFADLSPAEVLPVAAQSHIRRHERGERVFAAGSPAGELYVLIDGQVKERMFDAGGNETITELLTAGATFGEPGLFAAERTRILDMVVVEPAHVLHIPRAALLAAMARHQSVAVRLAEGLARDIRWVVLRLSHAGYLRVRDRLIATLRDLVDNHGVPDTHGTRIDLRLTHSTLAAMIFATRENVARAMAELTADGAVRTHAGSYYVDTTALIRLAHTDPPLPHRNQPTRK